MTDATPIAIAVVRSPRDEFLIGPRSDDVVLGGFWEFPGGKIEPGESAVEAATRECLEEAGIRVAVDRLELEQHFTYDHGAVVLHFFRCHALEDVNPKPPFRWAPREALGDYQFPEGNRELLAVLAAEQSQANADLG